VTLEWPLRERLAVIVVLLAFATAAFVAMRGATSWHVFQAGAYLVSVLVALAAPGATLVQVIGGQILAGGVLVGQGGVAWLVVVPVIGSVVATAELCAVVGRLGGAVARGPGTDLRRAILSAGLGAGVFAVVVFVGGTAGVGGILAIALASAACVGVAVVVGRG